MGGKYFLIDTTRCTACRGCQVACKAWNKLPGVETRQWGSPQNPPDLNAHTYRLVRFQEHRVKGKVVRYFFSDACRHCLDPPCKEAADKYVKGAIIKDPTGAIVYTNKTKRLGENVREVIEECPYNIPRLDPETKMLTKCHMCYERISKGLEPACAKACPTGALNFGNERFILKLAAERLEKVKNKFGDDASLIYPDEVRAIYLVATDPAMYHEYAAY